MPAPARVSVNRTRLQGGSSERVAHALLSGSIVGCLVRASERWRGWSAVLLGLLFGASAGIAPAAPWKFLVFGDSRGTDANNQINTNTLAELARATVAEKPAFVLFPGDLVASGTQAAFEQWTNLMAPVYQAGIRVYPVMGNHDAADVPGFIHVFGASVPSNGPAGEIARTYSFVYSNALFLALDVYVTDHTLRVNQDWVDAVLGTNRQQHVFAMSHVPAFKVLHTDCLDDYAPERNRFWTSLTNAHCRMYLCGHDHFFDHLRVDDSGGQTNNDVHQFIVGTAGAPLAADGLYDGLNAPWTPTRVYHEEQYGYLSVQVDGDNVSSTWYHRVRKNTYRATTDTLAYTVPAPVPVLNFTYSSPRLTLTWSGTALLQAAPSLQGPFTNVTAATSPYVLTNVIQPRAFYRLVQP